MPLSFLDLPGEVRNAIYEEVLIDQWAEFNYFPTHADYLDDYGRKMTITLQPAQSPPGILATYKAIHREASSILYYRFRFVGCTREEVAGFLEQIGPRNANYIRHVRLSLSRFKILNKHAVFKSETEGIVEELRKHCQKLKTITLYISDTANWEYHLKKELRKQKFPQAIPEGMEMIDTLSRSIPSLQEIIAEVYEGEIRRG